MHRSASATLLSAVFFCAATEAGAVTIVPGNANPNLAGRAGGYMCCSGDSSPPQDPALVEDIEIEACATLRISASGKVSYNPGSPTGNNPDGDEDFSMTNFGDGISAPEFVRANALVGVFLGDASPTGTATPDRLSFAGGGLAYPYISPEIGQIFFVGDGLTSDTNAGQFDGEPQEIMAPPAATRLFLGTADGAGWFNNSGGFSVEIESNPYEPERACGDPVDPPGVASSDSLRVLRAAVGTSVCAYCVCDVDRSGAIVASDALTVLKNAVGQDVKLRCGCCVSTCAELGEQCATQEDCCEVLVPPAVTSAASIAGPIGGIPATCCAGICQSFGICKGPGSECDCNGECCSGSCSGGDCD